MCVCVYVLWSNSSRILAQKLCMTTHFHSRKWYSTAVWCLSVRPSVCLSRRAYTSDSLAEHRRGQRTFWRRYPMDATHLFWNLHTVILRCTKSFWTTVVHYCSRVSYWLCRLKSACSIVLVNWPCFINIVIMNCSYMKQLRYLNALVGLHNHPAVEKIEQT